MTDLRQDTMLVGRREELYQLVHNLRQGRHTLLVGEKGVGKTRLMEEARNIIVGETNRVEILRLSRASGKLFVRRHTNRYVVLYVEHPNPLGDLLKELVEQLYSKGDLLLPGLPAGLDWQSLRKYIVGFGNPRLQQLVLRSIRGGDSPYLIFLDNLDRVTPGQHAFLEHLLGVAVICTAVVEIKEHFVYKRIWSSFSRIDLEPLPNHYALRLVDHILTTYPVRILDAPLYRTEVLKASNGNPFLIKTMLWHASQEQYIGAAETRTLRRLQEGHYFNMGPVYIFSASIFTIFKIFSLGTDNKEFYIYFSALGVIVYLTFRVFRAFFLFRPQKYDR